jgi:hypothetical protein
VKVRDLYPWVDEAFSVIREEGGAYLVCDCPVRNHQNSRLRLWLGDDGRLMFGCYACGPTMKGEILRAARLSWSDCFPAGTKIDRQHQECTAKYHYRDEAGKLLYMTLRMEPGRGGRDKDFVQRRPNPDYDRNRSRGPDNRPWLNSLGDVRRVLYRLPQLLSADPARPVFVVAGEKDADSLNRLGIVATTNVCGEAAEWLGSYSESLAGRHVVVIEDADAPGRRHANEVLGSVVRVAKSAAVVRLPQKDATAFLVAEGQRIAGENFGTEPEADELREELREAFRRAAQGVWPFRAWSGDSWQSL